MAIGRKAKVICITKHENSELAKLSDYVISVASREKLFLDEFNFTRVPFMAVIEILFLLTISNKKDAYECMNRHEQCMAEDKIQKYCLFILYSDFISKINNLIKKTCFYLK